MTVAPDLRPQTCPLEAPDSPSAGAQAPESLAAWPQGHPPSLPSSERAGGESGRGFPPCATGSGTQMRGGKQAPTEDRSFLGLVFSPRGGKQSRCVAGQPRACPGLAAGDRAASPVTGPARPELRPFFPGFPLAGKIKNLHQPEMNPNPPFPQHSSDALIAGPPPYREAHPGS